MEIAFIPKIILRMFSVGESIRYDVNILVSNLLIIILFAFFGHKLLEFLSFLPHFCLFDRIFGFECPVCGVTRAFCEFGEGDISRGFQYNYIALLVGAFVLMQIPIRLVIILKQNTKEFLQKWSRIGSRTIIILIIINWITTLFLTLNT